MRFKSIGILALAFTFLFPNAALAHDQLVDITPAAGETLTEGNFEMVLTFNNDLLVIGDGQNTALETQLEGGEWVEQEIEVSGKSLTARIELAESGNYQVRWKVVSSDSHAIEGESSFNLSLPEPIATEEPPVVIAPNPVPSEEPARADLTGFYFGLALVVLGAVLAPIGLQMRRRARKS